MITYHPIEEKHLAMMRDWRNSSTVHPYVREYRPLSMWDQRKWYENYNSQKRNSEFDQDFFLLKWNNGPIGVGGFTRIEWRNRKAELSFYAHEYVGLVTIEQALLKIVDMGFEKYNFNKITWPVYGHDPRIEIYAKVLKKEAILKEEYYWNGIYQDRIYLSLTRQQFEER